MRRSLLFTALFAATLGLSTCRTIHDAASKRRHPRRSPLPPGPSVPPTTI